MIEKMQFLSITGPKDDIDRVMKQYLSHYEIQLENALTELGSTTGLTAFADSNPYMDALDTGREILSSYGEKIDPALMDRTITDGMDTVKAVDIVEALHTKLGALMEQRRKIEKDLELVRDSEDKIRPFRGLDYDIKKILKFTSIRFRFGKMPREYYSKFMDYVYETIDAIMLKCEENQDYVWMAYFTPDRSIDKVDAVYASMHFERFYVPDEYVGTPTEATAAIDRELDRLTGELDAADTEIAACIKAEAPEFINAYKELVRYTKAFDVRKLAALTKHNGRQFYILCGWMKEKDAQKLRQEINQDEKVFYTVEKDHSKLFSEPPVSLRNLPLFRPFELYIRMYGLPSYGEFDPTCLVAVTYSILFGFMFGDAGQGLVLFLGGLLLYKWKKASLAGIIASCGFFSTFFGIMFGSFFGFENLIDARWLRPQEAMTRLPMIGNLNTVFVVAVAIGMGLILFMMIINMANAWHNHDLGNALFSTNGLAGFIFYGCVVLAIVLIMTGHVLGGGLFLGFLFGLPLLFMFLREPLTAVLEKKKLKLEGGPGMFIVQGFFEMFEVMLSYFSNTLSFVRVGAFAVSHAAMMHVVLMLAGAESGSTNWLTVILGNVFVMGMEGLIVGIQVLRLEYYELFSRFYTGAGREFVPYTEVKKK